jgi:hypothetical protein
MGDGGSMPPAAKQLYDASHVAAPGVALMQMANANVSYKKQRGNEGVTEIAKIPNRATR